MVTTLCWSLGIFPFTEAARRFGSNALNQYRLFLAWIVLTFINCLYYRISPLTLASIPSSHHYIYLGLSGIIGFTIGDFCTFNSFKMLGPKLSSVYMTIAPCAALMVGMLVLSETVNLAGIMGIFLTIVGVVWLTLSKEDAAEAKSAGFGRNRAGIVYALIGAICQGSGLVLSKYGFREPSGGDYIPTLHAVWIRLSFAFSAAMLIAIVTNNFAESSRIVFNNQNKGLKYMVAGTLLGPVTGVSCSLLAISYLKVAEAQTIFALLPVFVLPLNFCFYKEKITAASASACLIAICGVIVLIWREEIAQWI